jgi:hypothetical protein
LPAQVLPAAARLGQLPFQLRLPDGQTVPSLC